MQLSGPEAEYIRAMMGATSLPGDDVLSKREKKELYAKLKRLESFDGLLAARRYLLYPSSVVRKVVTDTYDRTTPGGAAKVVALQTIPQSALNTGRTDVQPGDSSSPGLIGPPHPTFDAPTRAESEDLEGHPEEQIEPQRSGLPLALMSLRTTHSDPEEVSMTPPVVEFPAECSWQSSVR